MLKKESVKQGLIAGFIATLCCTLPLVLIILAVFFGIGSITAGLYFGFYGEAFLFLGLAYLSVSNYLHLKKEKSCNVKGIKEHWKTTTAEVIVLVLVYFLVKFTAIPYLAELLLGGI